MKSISSPRVPIRDLPHRSLIERIGFNEGPNSAPSWAQENIHLSHHMITVRPIKAADVSGFRNALDSVCRERKFLATLEAPCEQAAEEFVRKNLESGYPQFVAESGGVIVGWCDAIPGDPSVGTAHVGRLGMGVVRDFRGQGIGCRLLDATINQARAIGLEKIELAVYASNTPAIALYRKFGFVEEGLKKRGRLIDGTYNDVLLLALILTTLG